jgi:hypothetical protein
MEIEVERERKCCEKCKHSIDRVNAQPPRYRGTPVYRYVCGNKDNLTEYSSYTLGYSQQDCEWYEEKT